MNAPTTEDKVNALACAVATLEGTNGGYSPNERMKAKMTLMSMLSDMEQIAVKELQESGG